tara:strand:+ start:3267 stop:3566 length:300 start_codon:yes stop_codon:yes gene_type:complete
MKITKEKLKNLIKEELQRTLEDVGSVKDQADVLTIFRKIPDEMMAKVDRPLEILDLLDEIFNRLGAQDFKRAAPIIKPYLRNVLLQLDRWDEPSEESEV